MTTELTHFGVKGMKWGKRKDPAKPNGAHRTRLEAKYISKGSDKATAEKKASNRIRTEKVLAVAGGVAATAALAYGAKVAYGKRFVGVSLDVGSELKNINAFGDKANLDRRLYTTIKDRDTRRYRGFLPGHLRAVGKQTLGDKASNTFYETTLKAKEKITAPSNKEAAKLYKEFISDKKNRDSVAADNLNPLKFIGAAIAGKPIKDMGEVPDYRKFNVNLVENTSSGKSFMDFVKSKGYNALIDTNDQFNGIGAHKPVILLNAKDSTVMAGSKAISKSVENKEFNRMQGQVAASALGKALAPYVALGGGLVAIKRSNATQFQYKAARKYLKDHPNSDMSLSEVYSKLKYDRYGRPVVN